MAQNKSNITPDNMGEWMASTGFLFPRTMKELLRFEKLYGDVQINLEGCQIDPEKILGRTGGNVFPISSAQNKKETVLRMAARKGEGNIPQHILEKMKTNQDKRKKDDSGPKKDGA